MNRTTPTAILLLVLAMAFTAGCETTRHGDALQTGPPNKHGLFRLPKFSIGQPGVHTFTVRNNQRRALPYKVRISTRKIQPTDRPYTGWERTVFKVDIIQGGSVLASTQFRPNRWHEIGAGEFEHIFYGPGQPAISVTGDYDVRVTVLRPAKRSADEAQLILR